MNRDEVRAGIRKWIAEQVLEGRDVGLDDDTPLLEWGVLNSLELVRLSQYVREAFGVEIPARMLVARHFKDLHAIAALVVDLASGSEPGRTP